MNAAQFYERFNEGFTSAQPRPGLKRLAGRTAKWKIGTSSGDVTFAFATNSKTAGLLPHLPGEFHLRISWSHAVAAERRTDEVSWFQYASASEATVFASMQRAVLEKFLKTSGKEGLRSIYNYSNDPEWLPRANFEECIYYFDASDAHAWGAWYATLLPAWLARFEAQPESFEDWCWRVLWADSKPVSPTSAP